MMSTEKFPGLMGEVLWASSGFSTNVFFDFEIASDHRLSLSVPGIMMPGEVVKIFFAILWLDVKIGG